MGLYGESKRKTMLRSILPCQATARHGVKKDLDGRRRRNRRRTNNKLTKYRNLQSTVAEEVYDDGDVLDTYVEMHHNRGDSWDDLVQERRDRDKLNHFVHWVETHGDTNEERVDFVKSFIPAGTIGAHAMSHVYSAFPINEMIDWRARRAERLAQFQYQDTLFYCFMEDIRAALHVIAHDDNKRNKLNRYMRLHVKPYNYNVAINRCRYNCDACKERVLSYHWDSEFKTCDYVPQIRGYHNMNHFFKEVMIGQCLLSENPTRWNYWRGHSHANWRDTLLTYLRIEMPEQLSKGVGNSYKFHLYFKK